MNYFEVYDDVTNKVLHIQAPSLDDAISISETINYDEYENNSELPYEITVGFNTQSFDIEFLNNRMNKMDNLTIFRNRLEAYKDTLVAYTGGIVMLRGLVEDDEWDYYWIVETSSGRKEQMTCCYDLTFLKAVTTNYDEILNRFQNGLIDEPKQF